MRNLFIIAALLLSAHAVGQDLGFGTYTKLFAQDSPWNVKPVNPVLSAIGIPTDSYEPQISEGAYSTGIYEATANDPPLTIYPRAGQRGVWDPDAEAWLPSVTIPHWPASAAAATGTDGHCDIVDRTTGIIHSFWILKKDAGANGVWRAQQWAWSRTAGRGWADPAHYYQGARATGVPTCGGVVRKHEYHDGDTMYRHVLAMSLTFSGLDSNPTYVFPATSADAGAASNNRGQIPEGALVMLPANFDVNVLQNAPVKKIARTLMTYGARVVDRNTGTPFAIYVENGTGWGKDFLGPGWDNDYANDLRKLRAALRMMSSANGWVDAAGQSVTSMNPAGDGLNLLSLRGPWSQQSGSPLGVFDSLSQAIRWKATGASPSVQRNTSGNGMKVSWGKVVPGKSYRFEVQATNGAKLQLEVRGGSNSGVLYSSGALGNGQGATFTCPNSNYVTLVATSGTNVASSSVTCTLIATSGGGSAPTIATQPQSRTVTVGQTASFSVMASGSPTPTYQWQKNGANITGATAATYTTPATIAADNGATFRVVVSNSKGSATSNAVTLTVTTSGLVGGDIGSVGKAGSDSVASGVWTVTGSGTDIWSTADGFHFVRQAVVGDVRITARVNTIGNTNPWAKAGVMVRESTAAGSRHAFTCVTAGNGVAFQRRPATNGASVHTAGPKVNAPYWVRLERIGNTLIGSCSTNGTTWTEVRRDTVSMTATVLVGLAVTSHANGSACTATFSQVEIVSAPSAAN